MSGSLEDKSAFATRDHGSLLTDRTLLITGGTGSFGQAVLRHLMNSDLREIRVFSRDEKKQDDLRHELQNDKVKFHIGDVRSYTSVHDAMRGVDFVFHAAALKQVPSCEFYPIEALQTNVLGAENVLRAAVDLGVSRCVVLSTDKAVYPINAMGMTKALMEKAMVAKSRICDPEVTVLCGTRYGNVMGSRGSVIPLFRAQAAAGLPITVTDPSMTRFMMSLDESVELVMHAFAHASPGDIFVQKAPAATIGDLAETIRDLLGSSSEVSVIGTRHGEKLFETLVSREEMARAREQGAFFRVPADNRDLNYSKYFTQGNVDASIAEDYTSHNTVQLSRSELRSLVEGLTLGLETADA